MSLHHHHHVYKAITSDVDHHGLSDMYKYFGTSKETEAYVTPARPTAPVTSGTFHK